MATLEQVVEPTHVGTVAEDWPHADFFAFWHVQGTIRARPKTGYPKAQHLHFVVYAPDGEQAKKKAQAQCDALKWGRLSRPRCSRLYFKDSDDVCLIAIEE